MKIGVEYKRYMRQWSVRQINVPFCTIQWQGWVTECRFKQFPIERQKISA
jgi:hypothetical protein